MDELLKKLPYWSTLNDTEKRTVKGLAIVNHYESGNTLHGNCDKGVSCLRMIYVISGELRAYILSEEGREITLFRLREGDCCVLSASCIISQIDFDTMLTATEDSDVLIVPTAVFGRLTSGNVHVRCFMYELATERFSTAMWVMQQILFYRFDQRLATFLLSEYQRTGVPTIRMTQEQIAQNVNSAREVVARMLKQFALDGLIENKRGTIELKNMSVIRKRER